MGLNIELKLNQKPDFTATALYVGAAGTACYELGAVGGVASVLLGAGHNQDAIGKQLDDNGAAVYAGRYLQLDIGGSFNFQAINLDSSVIAQSKRLLHDKAARLAMEQASMFFCDGLGAARVYGEIAKNTKSPVHA